MNSFTNKNPAESIYYGVDFSDLLESGETLVSGFVDISVLSGTDTNVTNMITTTPLIEGSILRQKVTDGVVGTNYKLTFMAYTNKPQSFVEVGSLLVQEAS